jgi:RNA polymerase primary sigma factor
LLDVLPNNDSAPADRLLLNESLAKEIERALSTLTERERDVVKLFFGIGINHGLTLEEIGAKFDLTRDACGRSRRRPSAASATPAAANC